MKKICDACGKSLTDKNGSSLVGMQISIGIVKNGVPKELKEFYQKQLGKYKINKIYNICYECLLKNLGVKP